MEEEQKQVAAKGIVSAVKREDEGELKKLIDSHSGGFLKAIVNMEDQNGPAYLRGAASTPLMIASQKGNDNIVRMLIEAGADVNGAHTELGNVPLVYAIYYDKDSVVHALLEAGANVNAATNKGGTLLMVASQKGNDSIVRALLGAGADVNAKNTKGESPLTLAADMSNDNIVDMLISAGADVNTTNTKGESPLMIAAEMGNDNIVRALLGAGADINATNTKGESPLMIAEKGDHKEIIRILVKVKGDFPQEAIPAAGSKDDPYQPQGQTTKKITAEELGIQIAAESVAAGGRITEGNARVGMRVIRGDDWKWKDQDKNGVGTITEPAKGGWVAVKWDLAGDGKYRCEGKFDLQLWKNTVFKVEAEPVPVSTWDLAKQKLGFAGGKRKSKRKKTKRKKTKRKKSKKKKTKRKR